MLKNDKIAILMATYNGENYLEEQIKSILQQTYSNWELYIHDDGSEDNTVNIINEYSCKNPKKIHVIKGVKTGSAKSNFFYLMRNVDAPYVMFCDQDDIWLKEKIQTTYQFMLETEKYTGKNTPVLVFSDLKIVDKNLNTIADRMSTYQKLNTKNTQFKNFLIQNVVTGNTTILNNACLKKSLEINDITDVIMHDWWCSLVAAYFGTIAYVDKPLVLYRQHKNNSIGAKAITNMRYIMSKMFKLSEIRESLSLTRKQALAFVNTYKLDTSSLANKYACNQPDKLLLQKLIP